MGEREKVFFFWEKRENLWSEGSKSGIFYELGEVKRLVENVSRRKGNDSRPKFRALLILGSVKSKVEPGVQVRTKREVRGLWSKKRKKNPMKKGKRD